MMRNIGLSKLQHLLFVLLLFALTGCGASNSNMAGTADTLGNGQIAAKLVWGETAKTTAKTVAAVPAGVVKIRMTVTGSDSTLKALPVVRNEIAVSGSTANGRVDGIYPGKVCLVVEALDSSGAVMYEGFALYVVITAGATTDVGTVTMSPPIAKAESAACVACHETTTDVTGQSLVANYKQSGHYSNIADSVSPKNGSTKAGCAGCHGTSHNDAKPDASGRCRECHSSINPNHDSPATAYYTAGAANTCGTCHQPHNPFGPIVGGSCVDCHSVGQNKFSGSTIPLVNDNNGVRAITTEFAKWSHHVTGVTLNDAHCAACHLEGTISSDGKSVIVDTNKHMVDAKVHLRNANDDSDFAWDPMAPNHTGMDNYCMSCHDASGAVSPMSAKIQAFINSKGITAAGKTASPGNPFGDTISNRYDKMQRPAVVDASSQFNTTNNSHHAVKGPRYTGRTRAAGARQIKSPATFAQNSSAILQGKRSTIYDAGNFNALYSPLGTDDSTPALALANGLGDDSTLHCGDCHTVGQWKVGSSETANGSDTPAAIGAHGSNNEYLLRNTLGTDQRHTQNAFTKSATNVVTYTNPNGAFLVCYNCHSYNRYGSIFVGTGLDVGGGAQPHAGEYDDAGRCNGIGNTLSFNGYTTGKATDGTQFESRFMLNPPASGQPGYAGYAGEQNPDFGNIFGIQCANCHNSGTGNAYGGIHGSANNQTAVGKTLVTSVTGGAYIDGMGNTTKIERFLPGLGNAMHVPGTLGGFTGGSVVPVNTATGPNYTYTTGGISNDTNWEQKHWQQTATTFLNNATGAVTGTVTSAGAGCYTLGAAPAATTALSGPSVTGAGGPATQLLDTWGGCEDHDAAQGKGDHGFIKRIVRPITY